MSEKDYEVGYGKPPKSGQFSKGQSGNPKGRPKGRKSLDTIIDDVFRRKVSLREGGKLRRISQIEALCRRILNDGLKGNARATDQAIKLLQSITSLKDVADQNDDGSAPDHAVDLAAIAKMLELHGVDPDETE